MAFAIFIGLALVAEAIEPETWGTDRFIGIMFVTILVAGYDLATLYLRSKK